GHAHRDRVALGLSDQGPPDRRLHGDAARPRVGLDRPYEVVGDALTVLVLHLDGGPGLGDAATVALDDLGAADHLLQLVDLVVEAPDLLFRLLVLWIVLDVSGLGRLLHAVGRLDPSFSSNDQFVLEPFQAFARQPDRLSHVHGDEAN